MAPYVTVILCAVVGYAIHGILGCVIGAGVGWCVSMVIGSIAFWISGGLLPRKARGQSAALFYMNHQPLVDSCIPGIGESEKLRLIEGLIERVFKRATIEAPMLSKTMGMSKRELEAAVMGETQDEPDPEVRKLLEALQEHILGTMY